MQATRAEFCDPAPVSLAAGSGSASMPVVLETGCGYTGDAFQPLALGADLHPARRSTALVLVEDPILLKKPGVGERVGEKGRPGLGSVMCRHLMRLLVFDPACHGS